MTVPQVGQGAVAVVPTFKGFRSAVSKESDAAAKDADTGFRRAFSKTGDTAGKTTGAGFKKAFQSESTGFSSKATSELEANVAKATRTLSTARLKEQDLAGKVRVAEAQLAEARSKYANDASQVVRAQERMESATRQLRNAQEQTQDSTNNLRDAQSRLASAADRAGDQLSEAGTRSGKRFLSGFQSVFAGSALGSFVGNLASNIASSIGFAIGNGIRDAVSFGIGTIDVASDLNESVNAVQVAFGDASQSVLALGDNSVQAFGLSKRNLNSLAVQFSAFAQTIRSDNPSGFLQELIGRGADFASVFNTDVKSALELFQSGLAGESEPLRKYGIDLSAASVEAYALSHGLVAASVDAEQVELAQNALTRATQAYADAVANYGEESSEASLKRDAVTKAENAVQAATEGSTAAMTEAQKQQARYGLLMEQTAKVQGDFANTGDSLANVNRKNAEQWDNIQASIGSGFLPLAQELALILQDDLFPQLTALAEEQGPAIAQAFKDALPAFTEMAQDVLPQLPGLFKSVADSLPAIIQGIQVATPLVLFLSEGMSGSVAVFGAFFDLITGNKSIDDMAAQLSGLTGPLGAVYTGALDMGRGFGQSIDGMVGGLQRFATETAANINNAVSFIQALPGRVQSFFAGAGNWLVSSGRALIGGFIDGINQMFAPVGNAVSGIISWATGFFPNSPAKRGPLSGSGWTNIGKSGGALIDQWTSGMSRSSLTVPLSAAITSTASAATSSSSQGSATYAGPDTLVIVDQDGQLIGRMRVEARGEVSVAERDRRTALQAGTRR